MQQDHYLLMTPGPLTTSMSVKQAMLKDWCTWDDDYNLGVVQEIRKKIVKLATQSPEFTSVLLQGSGSFAVEAALSSFIGTDNKLLVISNGAYGERAVRMCEYIGIDYQQLSYAENTIPSLKDIEATLKSDESISHLMVVHCETASGILNPVADICALAKQFNKTTMVDAMSSFGGVPFDMADSRIDILISSANKCIQGVPGFGFVLCKESLLKQKGHARSLSLDLHDQWQTMHKTGKWRFTSPTHCVRAFLQALTELEEEGGVQARYERYSTNQSQLVEGMKYLGFDTLVDAKDQSPFITSFTYPSADFNFNTFYNQLKSQGFVLYPGKISNADSFRIGTIGEIYPEDISRLITTIKAI